MVGQHDAAAHAREQLHAQAVLQAGHLAIDRAVRQRQLFGGAREAAQPRRGLEGLQGAQIRDTVTHWALSWKPVAEKERRLVQCNTQQLSGTSIDCAILSIALCK
ncbi:Uncharacterised protein [Bordetella pertussis]|nr:Uncharacterised protein [Bordetella pertussis]